MCSFVPLFFSFMYQQAYSFHQIWTLAANIFSNTFSASHHQEFQLYGHAPLEVVHLIFSALFWMVSDPIEFLTNLFPVMPCGCCSVARFCPNLCNAKDCSMPGFACPSLSQSWLRLMFIESVLPSNCLILLPPSPPALNFSQHQWSFPMSFLSLQVASVLELSTLASQSFQ